RLPALLQLGLPADERSLHAREPALAPCRREQLLRLPGANGLGLALELELLRLAPFAEPADRAAGHVVDEHRARARGGLKPGGGVDGVAVRAVFDASSPTYRAEHDGAGRDPDPDVETFDSPPSADFLGV